MPETPKSIDAIEHRARHDRILILMMLLSLFSITPLTSIVAVLFLTMLTMLLVLIRQDYRHPDFIGSLPVPQRTYILPYFFLTQERIFRWLFGRSTDFATISFPFLSIVFFKPSMVKVNRLGFRKAALLHEFGHCHAYDAFYVLVSIGASLYFIRTTFSHILIYEPSEANLPFFPLAHMAMGLVGILTFVRVMHRREFLADHAAGKQSADLFRNFLQTKAVPLRVRDVGGSIAESSAEKRSIWHPSYKERLDVFENRLRTSSFLFFIESLYWSMAVTLLFTSFFIPRTPVLLVWELSGALHFFAYVGLVLLPIILYRGGMKWTLDLGRAG